MNLIRSLATFGAVVFCLFFAGCGSSTTTSGMVTLDGKPLVGGGVTLYSTGGGAERVHTGTTGEDGAFTIVENDSNPIESGEYIVVVDKPAAEMGGKSDVPKIYRKKSTSPLRAKIDDGNRQIPPIQLTTPG